MRERGVKKWQLLLFKQQEHNLNLKYNQKMTQIELMKRVAARAKKMKEPQLSNSILKMKMNKILFSKTKTTITILLRQIKLKMLSL